MVNQGFVFHAYEEVAANGSQKDFSFQKDIVKHVCHIECR